MADKKGWLGLSFLANPKTRVIVIVAACVVVVGIFIAANGIIRSHLMNGSADTASRISGVPRDAQHGGPIDPTKIDAKQNEMRKEANAAGSADALQNGKTYVPVLRTEVTAQPDRDLPTGYGLTGAPQKKEVQPQKELVTPQGEAKEEKPVDEGERVATADEIKAAQMEHNRLVEVWKKRYLADIDRAKSVWGDVGTFHTQYAQKMDEEKTDSGSGKAVPAGSDKPIANPGKVLAQAGDQYYGVMLIGSNTDEPSAIEAVIVSGPFKGGKLIGAQSGATAPYSEKVVLQFTVMTLKGYPHSIPVKIFAVDPKTQRAAVADNVDRHLLMKFGVAAAVDFAQGYANNYAQRTQSVLYGSNGAPTTVVQGSLTNQQLIAAGVGNTMNKVQTSLAPFTTRPNTIEEHAKSEIGLFVASDIVYTDTPVVTAATPVKGASNSSAEFNTSINHILQTNQAALNQLISANQSNQSQNGAVSQPVLAPATGQTSSQIGAGGAVNNNGSATQNGVQYNGYSPAPVINLGQ